MIASQVATQSELGGNKKARRHKEGESSTNLPALEDVQIAQKVEQVIQKGQIGPRKEDECVLEGTTPFVSRIVRTKIPLKFKLP